MRTWDQDHKWASRFDRQIKMAIGPYVIGSATVEDDVERATDMILVTDRVRIACRMRRWSKESHDKYGHQFTIRSGRSSGAKTELAKILEGWGDLLFYGWGDGATGRLREWVLIDLDSFRSWHSESLTRGVCIRRGMIFNDDGSSGEAFDYRHMPEGGVVATGHGLQLEDHSIAIA